MNIGYFENFKFGNTVLLDCAIHEISWVLAEIKSSVNVLQHSRLICSEVGKLSTDPVSLYVVASKISADMQKTNRFHWLVSVDQPEEVEAMLNVLISSGSGHQYFDLLQRDIQLVVSVGEYREGWWRERG